LPGQYPAPHHLYYALVAYGCQTQPGLRKSQGFCNGVLGNRTLQADKQKFKIIHNFLTVLRIPKDGPELVEIEGPASGLFAHVLFGLSSIWLKNDLIIKFDIL